MKSSVLNVTEADVKNAPGVMVTDGKDVLTVQVTDAKNVHGVMEVDATNVIIVTARD